MKQVLPKLRRPVQRKSTAALQEHPHYHTLLVSANKQHTTDRKGDFFVPDVELGVAMVEGANEALSLSGGRRSSVTSSNRESDRKSSHT